MLHYANRLLLLKTMFLSIMNLWWGLDCIPNYSFFHGDSETSSLLLSISTQSVDTWMHTGHCSACACGTIGRACTCTWRRCVLRAQVAHFQTPRRQNQVSSFITFQLRHHFLCCMSTLIRPVLIRALKGQRLTWLHVAGCNFWCIGTRYRGQC